MSLKTFTWLPSIGTQQTVKPNVSSAKFGDGYEQRSASGINNAPQTWSLTFTLPTPEAKLLLAFFEEHGGVHSFNWVNPLGDGGVFVCRSWKTQSRSFGILDVTCDFEQSFDSQYVAA